MTEFRKNLNLTLSLALMGLTAWSASSSANEGSPACLAKVKSQIGELEQKTGHHPSNATQTSLLTKCSEAEVGLDLEGLFAKHEQEGNSDKESRCQTSVKFAKSSGMENSGRSEEELVSVCLSLPSDHEAKCGFPSNADEYYVLENQKCVSRQAGMVDQTLAKADGVRIRKSSGSENDGDDTYHPDGSSAQ